MIKTISAVGCNISHMALIKLTKLGKKIWLWVAVPICCGSAFYHYNEFENQLSAYKAVFIITIAACNNHNCKKKTAYISKIGVLLKQYCQ